MFWGICLVEACKIGSEDMGNCVSISAVENLMPFCAEALDGHICVPQSIVIPL
jgi:hypothetical protein